MRTKRETAKQQKTRTDGQDRSTISLPSSARSPQGTPLAFCTSTSPISLLPPYPNSVWHRRSHRTASILVGGNHGLAVHARGAFGGFCVVGRRFPGGDRSSHLGEPCKKVKRAVAGAVGRGFRRGGPACGMSPWGGASAGGQSLTTGWSGFEEEGVGPRWHHSLPLDPRELSGYGGGLDSTRALTQLDLS